MAVFEQTPLGRGYDTSLTYLSAANDYWQQAYLQPCVFDGVTFTARDLWDTSAPARGQNNSVLCSQANQAPGCVYEDALFATRVLETINATDPSVPFFFVWTPHAVHEPYEVPNSYLEKFAFIDVPVRRYYSAMVRGGRVGWGQGARRSPTHAAAPHVCVALHRLTKSMTTSVLSLRR